MTLVFSRSDPGPVTHVFLVGCGYYPFLGNAGSADRLAPSAGAVAMARFLLAAKDQLIAPLGSIELLVSDPDEGVFAQYLNEQLPEVTVAVERANAQNFKQAADAFQDRVRPGDVVLFYFSGHGVVNQHGDAVGLLEDVGSVPRRPWEQSFDMTPAITALRTLGAESVWVFFDACQEIAWEFQSKIWSVSNIVFGDVELSQLAEASCDAVAVAGARLGEYAHAPNDRLPPYFTQALLKGMSGCCVEPTRLHGWAVTGKMLLFALSDIADVLIDAVKVKPAALAKFTDRKSLLRVEQPFCTIAVRSRPAAYLQNATRLSVSANGAVLSETLTPGSTWRVDINLGPASVVIGCVHPPESVSLASQTLTLMPPSLNVMLELDEENP